MTICVAIGNCSFDECVEVLRHESLCEIRLDLLDVGDRLGELLRQPAKSVVTCRPAGGLTADREPADAAARRRAILERACALGAAYVDVEIEASDEFISAVRSAAKAHGTKLIVSYHDFERTPPRDVLAEVVERCFTKETDIAKVACKVNAAADNAVLLSLLADTRPLVVAGMGALGKITRIAAPLLGAQFTFASPDRGTATADGQLSAAETRAVYAALEKAGIRPATRRA
jgi:3-dehydroquinate dehydratase type I